MCTLIGFAPILLAGIYVLVRQLWQRPATGVCVVEAPTQWPSPERARHQLVLDYGRPATQPPPWPLPVVVGVALSAVVPVGTCALMLVAVVAARRHLGHWPGPTFPHYFLGDFEDLAFHNALYGLLLAMILQFVVLGAIVAAGHQDRRGAWAIAGFWAGCVGCVIVDVWTGYVGWAIA